MRYLLDTNVFIAAMRGVESVRVKLEQTALADLVLSPVVLGELQLGVEKSAYREQNAARLARLTEEIELVALDGQVSQRYGQIRAQLERSGTPIGANDLWIAAQGLALRAVVVTDNLGEFGRVPELIAENWLSPE